jgi:Uma2 family endonuclease
MSVSVKSPPPLENGDRLTRDEFERRYQATPHNIKAELIEGVVTMASAVRARQHGRPHAHVMTWLGTFEAATPGVMVLDNATVRLDPENEPQPDALLRLESGVGGSSRLDDADYVAGPPELVVEVAGSSASIDLHDKLRAYRRSGVAEYLVWQIAEASVSWFYLQRGSYLPLAPDTTGVICSSTFPGLCLDVPALLAGEIARVLAVLRRRLDSEAHREFVAGLERRRP